MPRRVVLKPVCSGVPDAVVVVNVDVRNAWVAEGGVAREARNVEIRASRREAVHIEVVQGIGDEMVAAEPEVGGVIFDVGHGGGSFVFNQAVPAIQQGFLPNSISTDLHIGSMNAGMKEMTNVMSKFLNLGLPLQDVLLRSTLQPAKEVHHEDLGTLSVGSDADVAVLRLGSAL
jgi:hypothetical protein